jgi:hypothetical protein
MGSGIRYLHKEETSLTAVSREILCPKEKINK